MMPKLAHGTVLCPYPKAVTTTDVYKDAFNSFFRLYVSVWNKNSISGQDDGV